MRIIVDAMGSDNSPAAQVEGSIAALDRHPELEITLTGPDDELGSFVGRAPAGIRERLSVVHAPGVIEPGDEPVRAVRRKKDSSMAVALSMVAGQKAHAAVSAGNTGALLAGGLLVNGRLPGVARPALGTVIATIDGRGVLFMDLGASADSRSEHMVQHALMGVVYAREVLERPRPRVALLNIGSEPGKGNQAVRGAYDLLLAAARDDEFEFAGNMEGRDLLAGKHDVIVADGFVGNVTLKVIEGVGLGLLGMMKEEIGRRMHYRLAGLMLRPAFRRVYDRLDYSEYGGATLLGLKDVIVKCHGSSNARAIANGIEQAIHMSARDVPGLIGRRLGWEEGESEV